MFQEHLKTLFFGGISALLDSSSREKRGKAGEGEWHAAKGLGWVWIWAKDSALIHCTSLDNFFLKGRYCMLNSVCLKIKQDIKQSFSYMAIWKTNFPCYILSILENAPELLMPAECVSVQLPLIENFHKHIVLFIEEKTLALLPTLCQVGTNASPIQQKNNCQYCFVPFNKST